MIIFQHDMLYRYSTLGTCVHMYVCEASCTPGYFLKKFKIKASTRVIHSSKLKNRLIFFYNDVSDCTVGVEEKQA